jgi:hypothetical protein
MDLMEAFQVITKDHIILALSDTKLVAMPLVKGAPELVIFDFSKGLPTLDGVEQPQLRGRFKADMGNIKMVAESLIKED